MPMGHLGRRLWDGVSTRRMHMCADARHCAPNNLFQRTCAGRASVPQNPRPCTCTAAPLLNCQRPPIGGSVPDQERGRLTVKKVLIVLGAVMFSATAAFAQTATSVVDSKHNMNRLGGGFVRRPGVRLLPHPSQRQHGAWRPVEQGVDQHTDCERTADRVLQPGVLRYVPGLPRRHDRRGLGAQLRRSPCRVGGRRRHRVHRRLAHGPDQPRLYRQRPVERSSDW